MADRIIKSDSGNDTVIQNNSGSRKIEVTNSGDVEVTGDLKATTVKATNLKANDGTASLEVADSTGDIGFSGNTNLKIKLPSAGGIYESDGSTPILTESGGAVTIQNATFNGTIASTSVFPAGGTGNAISVAIVGHQVSASTHSGTFSTGAWEKRLITTEFTDDDSIVTIDSTNNRFTVTNAGTYTFFWSAQALKVNEHITALYDYSNTTIRAYGNSATAAAGDETQNSSTGSTVLTISGSTIYELHHQCATTRSTNGFGQTAGFGSPIFSYIIITRLK